ncbi:hypothetical protein QQF64_033616 [Cirrhinus molitorella]|uniref:Uncharacterized protein n=1 Tax=Cirrhinus molitorella TaxID=172907 RepID=A0ABR3MUC9_9TELE
MALSSIATSIPLTCKLCPNNLLPDDGHEICPSWLSVQNLREALTDPCLHCSLLPMSERRLRLAELDPNSAVRLGQLEVTPPQPALPSHLRGRLHRKVTCIRVWRKIHFLRLFLSYLQRWQN